MNRRGGGGTDLKYRRRSLSALLIEKVFSGFEEEVVIDILQAPAIRGARAKVPPATLLRLVEEQHALLEGVLGVAPAVGLER